MKQRPVNSKDKLRIRKVDPLAKKKAIAAVVLVVIMAGMWIRVLSKNKSGLPAEVSAETLIVEGGQVETAAVSSKSHSFKYIELPVVEGRNDRLTHDLFEAKEWSKDVREKVLNTAVEIENEAEILVEEITQVAESLKIEAIIEGQNGNKSEVYIENKLVPSGSEFTVRRNDKRYLFTIDDVRGSVVTVSCGDVSVKLKMSDKDEKTGDK